MRLDNNTAEEWFPTFVRYTGLITTVVLIGFSLGGYATEAAPGFVAAAGMILYKTIHSSAKSTAEEDSSE
jgi:hypothetical protein